MKISITEKFLWNIYDACSKTGGLVFHPYPTMRNSLPGVENPIFAKYRKEKGKREFSNLIYYLRRKGYIKIKELENKKAIIITKEGINKALKASFKTEGFKRRKDGKWIMLIFDIPVKFKKARALLRGILRNLGYKLFQQSVWVSPYDVSERTEKSLQMYSLEKYVKIFIVEEI